MPPIVPDTLLQQRYRILNILGEGEFRRIYLATDSARTATAGHDRTDEYCAIEEFIPTEQFPAAVARAKEFFKQQASLLYQLHHIQVPRFWAIFEEQNRLFLVRDYVEGKTYQQLLEQRRDSGTKFSEDEVWRFMLQILPAIGYIHSKGAIHRDISPANIILRDRDRLPVLNNFGVVTEFAKRLQADPFSQDLIKIGKTGYSCPEQLRGGQIYPNSDLYSLAVTAIVLLTGKEASALFEGDRMNWDWRKWTPISDDFANVLQRMLTQPQERYQSALEVERDLQSLQIADCQSSEPTDSDLNYPIVEDRVDPNRFVELPNITAARNQFTAASQEPFPATNPPILPSQPIPPIKSEVTNLDIKSFWEKPQVFIPLGLAIALLTGLLSWFGVSFLLHRQTDNTPPKQADVNNPTTPTLPTDRSPTVVGSELIQPIMDRAVIREGTVGTNTPVKYRIAAVAGQNLDIQLLPIASQTPTSTTPNPPGATDPNGSPATPPTSSTSTPSDPNNPSTITSTPAPSANQSGATQVLMSVLSPSGVPVDPQADRVIGWRGQITTAGEQTIELRPIKGLTGTSFPYKLSVTQVGIAPPPIAPTTTPSSGSIPPAGVTTPPTDSTTVPPVSVPVPIGGNGLDPSLPTTSPNPNLIPPGDLPTTIPTPAPTDLPTTFPNNVPTESAPPPRRRRRARVDADTTPTPRRRKRNRIVTNSEQTTPTPRRQRRNRSATADTQPRSTPKSGNTNNKPPSEAPGIPIDVPTPGSPSKSEPKSDAPGIPIQVPTPKR
jgi:serine/threonine protein kinase